MILTIVSSPPMVRNNNECVSASNCKWISVNNGLYNGGIVLSLAIDSHDTVYAGTGGHRRLYFCISVFLKILKSIRGNKTALKGIERSNLREILI